MARVDNLDHFLTDVANAIRTKKSSQDSIQASSFDTAILSIPTGGGVDLTDYFASTLITGMWDEGGIKGIIKRLPDYTILDGTDCSNLFSGCTELVEIPLLNTSSVTNMSYMFSGCTSLTSIPEIDTSSNIEASGMFYGCTSLTSIPNLDFGNVTNVNDTFNNCTNLVTVPQFDFKNATAFTDTFRGCTSLSNESLNNILATCISAVKWTVANRKTLKNIFGVDMSAYYPAATIQSLSNYNDFVAAGWSIGW